MFRNSSKKTRLRGTHGELFDDILSFLVAAEKYMTSREKKEVNLAISVPERNLAISRDFEKISPICLHIRNRRQKLGMLVLSGIYQEKVW